jgi:multiple sugar transport system permease protein
VSGQQVNWFMNEKTVMPAFIIMGLWGAGGGTIILLAGLQNIAQQYYEASKIDGAGPIRQFFSITLPLLSPTLFFSLITGVIGSFQVFTQAFIITSGGPNNATVFYMLNLYSMAFRDLRMGYASALAWILFVIILVFTAIQLKAAKKWVFYEGDEK